MSETKEQVDGLKEILTWSSGCPDWQRDALRRLCLRADLVTADEAELLEVLKGRRAADPLTDQHIRRTATASQSVTLKAISQVENVNALAGKQTLSFCDKGITTVYGDNGSGKSGYVRILKSACRARLERGFEVRPNIYGASGVPTASISYVEGTTNCTYVWEKGQPTPVTLSGISVFDSAAATVHVTGTNEIAYTPFPLLVLGQLANAADDLQRSVNGEIQQFESQIPPTISSPQCSRETTTGKVLWGLSGKTKPETIEALSALSDDEKAQLTALKRDLADDPAAIASRSARLAQRLDTLSSIVDGAGGTWGDEPLQALLQMKIDIEEKAKLVQLEAERRFAGDPLVPGSELWHELWRAARAYAETEVHPGRPFPKIEEDALCVLCQRPLDSGAADRLTRFAAFVADELGKQLRAAQEGLRQAMGFEDSDYLDVRKIAEIREYLDQVGEPELGGLLREFLVKAAWRRRWMRRASGTEPLSTAPPIPVSPSPLLRATARKLQERAHALQGSATSPERKALKDRLDELSDREWLVVVKDDVLKAIALKQNIENLKAVLPQTARAKITTKSTSLAKSLVTDRLRDRFAAEVAELGISRLRVELRQERSEAGQPRFKVCFVAKPSENVGAVLSEGETRCLAIGAFLAELETESGSSGIVLDDPISSLDHVFREKVATRLAKEGQRRQVIVFTHDIPFLVQLQQACKNVGTLHTTRLISRGGAGVGFCFNEAPPTHRPVEDAITALRTDVTNRRRIYDTGDMTRWAENVIRVGGVLRQLWERAVEDVISPVLTRWTHRVRHSGLHSTDCHHARRPQDDAAGVREMQHVGALPARCGEHPPSVSRGSSGRG
jgi:ABC-type cobalamin/Fe3+-siderophores transport system ATPase subunit